MVNWWSPVVTLFSLCFWSPPTLFICWMLWYVSLCCFGVDPVVYRFVVRLTKAVKFWARQPFSFFHIYYMLYHNVRLLWFPLFSSPHLARMFCGWVKADCFENCLFFYCWQFSAEISVLPDLWRYVAWKMGSTFTLRDYGEKELVIICAPVHSLSK